MFKKIEKPAACEMRSVILFLNARNMKPTDIHRQLCEVYGEHDSTIRRRVRHFNEGRENVHDNPRSGRPSVVNEDLVRAVEEKFQENRRFTISSLSLHFP
jgi:transposase